MPRRSNKKADIGIAAYLPRLENKVTVRGKTLKNQKRSRFLCLPGEVRNTVYDLACTSRISVSLAAAPHHDIPALRLVCKQTFSETKLLPRRYEILRLEQDLYAAYFCYLLDTVSTLQDSVFRCVEMPVEFVKALALDLTMLDVTKASTGWVSAFSGKRAGWCKAVEKVVVWRGDGKKWDDKVMRWIGGVVMEVFGDAVEVVFHGGWDS